ncbi:MAG: M23 family metallopeptidase [Candidatus Calescibacterium sp.]|nr:M23 family metallopeptidase [Candidatus Calescibacterium sp.]
MDATEGCVEPGGIVITEKIRSDFSVSIEDRSFYFIPVPITATSLYDYDICEKEFPVEKINIKRRKRKASKFSDEDLQNKIKRQKEFLKSVYLEEPKPRMWEGNFIIPVKNYKSLKENFGARRIINGVPGAIHRGIDISAHKGEKVYASNSGIVVVARKFILEGNLIVINHGTGIYTIYAHLKDMVVGEGDFVKKGQLIGYVGNTGRSTGPHLHFGAKMGQIDINPFALFEIQDALSVALSSVNSY